MAGDEWKNASATMLVELRPGDGAEVFVDDGSVGGDGSAVVTLDELVALGHWALAHRRLLAARPLSFALARANRNLGQGNVTEIDVQEIVSQLEHDGELGKPSSQADYQEVMRELPIGDLLDLSWRQHVQICRLKAKMVRSIS